MESKKIISAVAVLSVLGGMYVWFVQNDGVRRVIAEDETLCGVYGSTKEKVRCYRSYYEKLSLEEGSSQALANLQKQYNSLAVVRSKCHELAHIIGWVAGETYVPQEALEGGNHFCASGYYHGVMEWIITRTNPDTFAENINRLCADLSDLDKKNYRCFENMGHGLIVVEGNKPSKSLLICDRLEDDRAKIACAGGVYSDHMFSEQEEGQGAEDDSAFMGMCREVPLMYKAVCYRMQSTNLLRFLGQNAPKLFEWLKL